MDDRHQDRELTDEQIATVMPGVTQVMDAREADRDGTDGDANDGTDGDANDGTDGDAKDADGTDTPSTS
jgi:hypothetical protein